MSANTKRQRDASASVLDTVSRGSSLPEPAEQRKAKKAAKPVPKNHVAARHQAALQLASLMNSLASKGVTEKTLLKSLRHGTKFRPAFEAKIKAQGWPVPTEQVLNPIIQALEAGITMPEIAANLRNPQK